MLPGFGSPEGRAHLLQRFYHTRGWDVCLRAEHIHLHSCQPFPQKSQGSLGWKPGLSVAHAEEKAQWQSPVCTDLSSAGLLPVVLGLAEAEGTVIKLLLWSPAQTRTPVRLSTAELLML